MEKLNVIKCIVNEKNCYINRKNMKTNMRYILKLQEVSQTEVVGGQRTATCQILVVLSCAIHVVMQRMNTKIMHCCSSSIDPKSFQLTNKSIVVHHMTCILLSI
jgi:hypothetical protein